MLLDVNAALAEILAHEATPPLARESTPPGREPDMHRTSAPAYRYGIALTPDGIPEIYSAAWDAMRARRPARTAAARWSLAVEDGRSFLPAWGPVAAALGWPARHLFEAPTKHPGGLLWELRGGTVMMLTDRQAVTIQIRTGQRMLYSVLPTGTERGQANG